jgi:peptide/nickel transport system substrate-binding protein
MKSRSRLLTTAALVGVVHFAPTAGFAETLNINHPLAFGAETNVDPIDSSRLSPGIEIIYDRLVRPSRENGAPEPALATAWSANETATEWTFTLRAGVNFHDGTTFDAGDVAYTFNRVIAPETDVPVKAVLSLIDTIDVIDETHVRFNLKSSHADFPLLLLDYRAQIIPEGSGDTIADTGIGTGPFMLQTLDAEGVTELVVNPDYWDGASSLDGINIVGISDTGAAQQAFAAGQLDFISGLSAEQQAALGDGFTYQTVTDGGWRAIVFNTQTEEFSDPRLRKALRILANREQIIERALGAGGGAVACDNPVWPGDPYYIDLECDQDQEEAKRLLAEAGHADGLTVEVFTSPLDATWAPMLEVYQAQAREVGVDVQITTVPSDGFWNDVWMKQPATTTYWGSRPADQILNEAFRSGAKWNETFWNVPEFDAALDAARQELDPDLRRQLYHNLQRTLYEEGGAFIPFFLNSVQAVQPNVTWPLANTTTQRWHLITKE